MHALPLLNMKVTQSSSDSFVVLFLYVLYLIKHQNTQTITL